MVEPIILTGMSYLSRQEIVRKVSIPLADVYLVQEGIVLIAIKEEISFDLEDVKLVEAAYATAAGYTARPILIIPRKFVTPTREAMEYMGGNDRIWHPTAEAFLIRSLPQKLVGNFYLKFTKPVFPTKLFTEEELAVEWLRSYLKGPCQ